MYVKPVARVNEENVTIVTRDPALGDFLPVEGREVQDSPYWQRRIADGDVVRAEPPAEAPPT